MRAETDWEALIARHDHVVVLALLSKGLRIQQSLCEVRARLKSATETGANRPMSAHVSVFDLKRFAEARLAPDELPTFEQHLSACASCAGRLQLAATRELHARGLVGPLGEPPSRRSRR